MTDGILLAEMQRDRQLLRYDTLIIDEAHERSLNIDFILGYLKRLLPSRPDLKVIITSATIDPERFSKHFAEGESGKHRGEAKSGEHGAEGETGKYRADGESGEHGAGGGSGEHGGEAESGEQGCGAPVIEVSGRTYPVEVRYRPLADPAIPVPNQETRCRPSATPSRSCAPKGLATSSYSSAASGRSGTPPRRWPAVSRRRPGGAAALRPAVSGRAAPGLPATSRAAGGPCHQRRGDLADRAWHQVRDRPGHRADLQVQPADQGSAAADRADLPGVGEPAQGPVRAHVRRRVHPALQRGGLRLAPGIHRPGDPAHQPGVGHPADGGARPRRGGGLPVRRPAGLPECRGRRPPA